MIRALIALLGLAALPVKTALAQGWHGHGPRREPRHGIGTGERARPRGRGRAA